MLPRRAVASLAMLVFSFGAIGAGAQTESGDTSDPYLWLEDVSGARASDWVKAENAKTLSVLQRDRHFAQFNAEALKINEATDRIPVPNLVNGRIYNFWRDANHVRGIWRTTSVDDFARPQPAWKTVLDLDALAKTEQKNWIWAGSDCDSAGRRRCLIRLSDGGEDAVTIREFDLGTGEFVANGFSLPRGKQNAAWVDDDTLLVSREWEPGDLTASGYPFIVKKLQRAAPLANVTEVFRGTKADVSVTPFAQRDGRGHRALFIRRGVSFFRSETQIVTPDGPRKLNIPLKSSAGQLVAGRLLIALEEPWNSEGATLPAGVLTSVDLAAAMRDPEHLKPTLVFAPTPRQSLESVAVTRDHAVVAYNDNVKGRAVEFTPDANGGWSERPLQLPDNSAIGLGSADKDGASAFLFVSGFLRPSTLLVANTDAAVLKTVKTGVPKFDASADVVEQRYATSKDGTQIPYFVVRPKNLKFDGKAPTILNAYGGFSVSMTPNYNGDLGKLWLERGGVYVLANIRGGGEFGPAWHEAGLKTHRQRIYDDFAAVGRDLIAKHITSPRHLGIEGGSNGGLLMGVEFTQHPELWNAVTIAVPLLDMLRFEKIAAGASWVGEYGSVSNPDERAFLASISPYNNLKPGVRYPEPLIWTTMKDDRVGPQHARKFAAKLSAMRDPYYFYEVIEGGHGSGANIREQSFTTALSMTYFARKLR